MNIAEILKDAPRGTKLYSPLCGECFLIKVSKDGEFIHIRDYDVANPITLNKYGKSSWKDSEILLFPSKNRDWSTFKVEPQFPTDICNCGAILDIPSLMDEYQYKKNELNALRELLLARDAWWKVDNDWKPDWRNPNEEKSTIALVSNKICIGGNYNSHCILAFRTEEIRDKFLETFRDLIEQCKELI